VVSASQTLFISGTVDGVTLAARLTVNASAPPPPAAVSTLALGLASVVGGNGSTATATLAGAAPAASRWTCRAAPPRRRYRRA
jgi:hypothetical protein